MQPVNIFQAKTTLSKLVEQIESGQEHEVIIARHGRPVAKLVGLERQSGKQRLGVAKGAFVVPDSIDQDNLEITSLFQGGD